MEVVNILLLFQSPTLDFCEDHLQPPGLLGLTLDGPRIDDRSPEDLFLDIKPDKLGEMGTAIQRTIILYN